MLPTPCRPLMNWGSGIPFVSDCSSQKYRSFVALTTYSTKFGILLYHCIFIRLRIVSIILIPFFFFRHLTSRTSCFLSFPPRSLASSSWCLIPSPSLGSSLSVWILHYLVKLHFGTWSISTHSQDDFMEFYSFKYHLNADDSQICVSSLDLDLSSRWFSPPTCWVICTLPPHLASPVKCV